MKKEDLFELKKTRFKGAKNITFQQAAYKRTSQADFLYYLFDKVNSKHFLYYLKFIKLYPLQKLLNSIKEINGLSALIEKVKFILSIL